MEIKLRVNHHQKPSPNQPHEPGAPYPYTTLIAVITIHGPNCPNRILKEFLHGYKYRKSTG